MSQARHIAFLVYPGFQLLDLTGPLTMFAGATNPDGNPAYTLSVIAEQPGPVTSSTGLSVVANMDLVAAAGQIAGFDTVFAIGGPEEALRVCLASRPSIDFLREAVSRVPRLASVCSGAFLLAATGRLGRARVTTHWRSAARLARHYPDLEVEPDLIFVRHGNLWTSAGVTAGIDLALALIETDLGRDSALAVAREHVVYRIRSGGQTQFSADLAAQASQRRELTRLVDAIRSEPGREWVVDGLSELAGVSRRTLSRMCKAELNLSPARLVERVRLELARCALVDTDKQIDVIAYECGFGPARRLDRAFNRVLGITPGEFRQRFRSSQAREFPA